MSSLQHMAKLYPPCVRIEGCYFYVKIIYPPASKGSVVCQGCMVCVPVSMLLCPPCVKELHTCVSACVKVISLYVSRVIFHVSRLHPLHQIYVPPCAEVVCAFISKLYMCLYASRLNPSMYQDCLTLCI